MIYIMKKILFGLIALIGVAQMWASDIQPSTTLTTYYASIDGKSGEAIRTSLYQKINAHTTVSYDNLKYLFKWTDTYENAGLIIDDIYSFCDPDYTLTWCSGTCGYNREHSVPKSWFGEATPLYSDAFHLYPTNCYVNSYRGNEPFGECANGTPCTTNGVQAKGRKGASTFPGYAVSGVVYEVADEFKGDLARTYFYMVTCYMTSNFTQAEGGRTMFTYSDHTAQLSAYSIDLLLKWHRQDPVSRRELVRNEVIYGNPTYNKCEYNQGNRNPFIDYPELVEYIWGNRSGQSVNIAALVSAYDGDVPGPGPEPEVQKFGVTWSVNGVETLVDSVQANRFITALPPVPVSCSTESSVFMGWTDAPIADSTDVIPAVLYRAVSEFPPVTADVTYYAVFAKEEVSQGSEPATYIFNADHQEGWTNTAGKQNSYWLLVQGKYIESPTVDLAGLSSITMNIRTYSGSGNPTVHISAGENEIATLTAANNKLADYTWTNTGVLSGMSPLRFEATAHATQGVGFASITITATGAGVTYSRYITSCQQPTEVEIQPVQEPARKVLIGGQIYILVGERLYTITGQYVK